MNIILRRIMNRAKKLAILLLLIPILTAGAAYVLASQVPATYTAKAEIMLGNFENTFRTDPNVMKKYILSSEFLKEINEEYDLGLDIGEIKSRFTVNALVPEKVLELSYRGNGQEESKIDLNNLIDGILKESTERFDEKKIDLEASMKEIEEEETKEEAITKVAELHKFKEDYANLQNSFVLEEVTVGTSSAVSPIQRAILGFLIGIIFSVFLLLLPELFRDEKK